MKTVWLCNEAASASLVRWSPCFYTRFACVCVCVFFLHRLRCYDIIKTLSKVFNRRLGDLGCLVHLLRIAFWI